MKSKFIKPSHDIDTNPVDYFNQYGTWDLVFKNIKNIVFIDDKKIANSSNIKKPSFTIDGFYLNVIDQNDLQLPQKKYTRFMLFSKLQFKGNYHSAIFHIETEMLHKEIPYIRVGTDYFKIIYKKDRYGIDRKNIKGWRKEEIKQDHPKSLLDFIPKYDDFCIEPDNINYQPIVGRCYNLYSEFSHKPNKNSSIETTLNLLHHIFGEQLEIGLKYMKILYENPKQMLPVLCLVSSERQTGKTTFINWINMIFGENFTMINPEDLSSQFNSSYAYKNIIAIDETVIDRIASVEKLKSIATAKSISVNQKFVANYSIPFFGKIIISTNKENDFMRIDDEEIRFWVRKIKSIQKINTNIENELTAEIPSFLKYLSELPAIDFTRSRMVFTQNEIKNDQLDSVKKESWSGLRKNLHELIEKFFYDNGSPLHFYTTTVDIKNMWFHHDNHTSVAYIRKVLKDEMGMMPMPLCKYTPFISGNQQTGRPYKFYRKDFLTEIPSSFEYNADEIEDINFEKEPF
jgi:hypothetical protein